MNHGYADALWRNPEPIAAKKKQLAGTALLINLPASFKKVSAQVDLMI